MFPFSDQQRGWSIALYVEIGRQRCKTRPMNPLSAAAKAIGLSAFGLGLGWTVAVQALQPPPDADRHWAFQPVRAVEVPVVKNTAWAKTEVDRFILARLEAARLSPAPAADLRTLI